jgi:hypothetical protein
LTWTAPCAPIIPEGFEAFVIYAGQVGLTLSEEQIKICEREAHRY